jgi:galactokinase
VNMDRFEQQFGCAARSSASAPGRVNLLGEHTDYNDGYVLPLAIGQTTVVQLAPSPDGRHHFYSVQLDLLAEHDDGTAPAQGFASYLHGCVEIMRERGWRVPPLRALVDSNVPMGEGLSSSAALEVAFLRALRRLLQLELDDVELALCAQAAEIRYAGVRCGVMDQMASSLASTDSILFLDTRTLERELLPLPAGTAVIVIGSGVTRELAASGYNQRRQECEAAASQLGVKALRDVTDPEAADALPPPLDRRARHVITENARVLEARSALDAPRLGALMNASHASLRDDYEVSVGPLDRLAALLQNHSSVYGAKLTGAGFGGACVALARAADVERVVAEVMQDFVPGSPDAAVLVPSASDQLTHG